MNYMKIKGEFDVNQALQHSDRGQQGVSDKQHSNDKIDPTRTHLNYELKDRGGLTAIDYHTKRIEEIAKETKQRTGKTIRKDAVTLCSWAVTAPQDLPRDKLNDFFKESYLWFSKRYGADNIVTAAVHLDETTPHMHLQFTPIVTDKKGNRKLCAKDLETPTSLKKAHQILQKHLTDKLGCEVNLLNGATDNGNKTILQLKNEELQKQIEELQEVKADEVGRVAKAFQGIAEKIKLGHKLNPSEMQVFEKTTEVIEQLQKAQAEAEQAKKTAESHEKALQERESNFDSEVHAKAQELSESLTAGFNRRLKEINQQAEKKIRAAEQERDEQKRQKEIVQQQLQEQKQLQQQAEQLREQAVEVATKYAYLVDEIGIPDNLKAFESDLWQQLQEVINPDEQQQKMTDDFELI